MKKLAFILLCMYGCTGVTPMEYARYVEDKSNGLHKKSSDEYNSYEIFYQPVEYLALRQFKTDDIKKADFKHVKRRYEDGIYYVLYISPLKDLPEKSPEKSLTVDDSYLDFGMQNDLKLVVDNDTSNCTLYHHEPQTGKMGREIMMLEFNKPECTDCDLHIIYTGSVYNSKQLSFTINPNDISAVPDLKF